MKIYVNGDSFTDGDGLGDAETFPGLYPGNRQVELGGNIVDPRWSNTRHKLLSGDLRLWVSMRNNNRKYVWATILGQLVDATVTNNAVGGSCMTGIATRTIADLNLIHSPADLPDYVFIGLTASDRLAWHDKNYLEHINQTANWVKTAIPAFKGRMIPQHYEKMMLATWETLSDEELLINYLKECLQIKNYVNVRIGRNPIFLNTAYQFVKYIRLVESSKNQWLRMLWFDLLEFDKISHLWFNHGKYDELTSCGHAVPERHLQFAKDIASEHFGQRNSTVDKDA